MHEAWYIKLVPSSEIHFYHFLMSHKKTRMVKGDNFICAYFCIARSADSLPGIVTNLNNKESRMMSFSANASTLSIAFFLLGNLF